MKIVSKILLGFVIVCCISLWFAGCIFTPEAPEVPADVYYTVTVNTNNASGGSVTGGGSYLKGSTVTITATASEGYYFDGWSDNSQSESVSFVVNSNRTITANFFEGNMLKINGFKVVVKNGTIAQQVGYYTITANNRYAFGYWYTTNASVPVSYSHFQIIYASSITSNVTYTAYDSACGFAVFVFPTRTSYDAYSVVDRMELGAFTNQTTYHSSALMVLSGTSIVTNNGFSYYGQTTTDGKPHYTYEATVNFTGNDMWSRVYKVFKTSGSNSLFVTSSTGHALTFDSIITSRVFELEGRFYSLRQNMVRS